MTSAEAQPSDASDSEPPSEVHRSGSVFDFLYHDARRVGSFLAQFEMYGVPAQVRATESAGRTATTRLSGQAGANLLTAVKANAALDLAVADDERDAAERTYDPLWTNARALLDYLFERDLIRRDLWDARVGQFVLASGSLIVLDVAMLKAAWDKPSVKKLVTQGAQVPAAKGHRKGHAAPPSQAQLLIELLTVLPHSLQAHLLGADYSVWCSLSESSLVGMSSDLVLKHGALVPGEWHILGVLDAQPDVIGESEETSAVAAALDAAVAGTAGTAVGTLAAQLAPVVRQLLGRPRPSFGMTPLLIFREVSG